MLVTAASLAVGIPAVLVAGRMSDRVGRKPLLAASAFAMVVVAWPGYWLFTQQSFGLAVLAAVLMVVVFAGTNGVLQVTLCEMFPTRVRTVSYGVGYNLGTAIFGGGAPLLLSWLIGVTGSYWVPCFYLAITCLVAGFAATRIRETAFSPLAK
jgi:MFS transporter, MHS family, proline/betaine transporter